MVVIMVMIEMMIKIMVLFMDLLFPSKLSSLNLFGFWVWFDHKIELIDGFLFLYSWNYLLGFPFHLCALFG